MVFVLRLFQLLCGEQVLGSKNERKEIQRLFQGVQVRGGGGLDKGGGGRGSEKLYREQNLLDLLMNMEMKIVDLQLVFGFLF